MYINNFGDFLKILSREDAKKANKSKGDTIVPNPNAIEYKKPFQTVLDISKILARTPKSGGHGEKPNPNPKINAFNILFLVKTFSNLLQTLLSQLYFPIKIDNPTNKIKIPKARKT